MEESTTGKDKFQPTGEPPKGIKTRQNPILPSGQLDNNKVSTAVGAIAVLVVYALFSSCGQNDSSKIKKDVGESGSRSVNEVLASLPSDYPDWKEPKTESYSAPGRIGEQTSTRPIKDPWELEQERMRLKRALDARDSDISFKAPIQKVHQKATLANQISSAGSLSTDFANYPALTPGEENIRDEANRQDDKRKFLENTSDTDVSLRSRLERPRSPYELKAGTIIPGILIQGINSDLPGYIRGQVSEQVYDTASGEYLLIPQGTKAIGRYDSRVTFGQKRLLIVWNRLIFPNGNLINLEVMPGADLGGFAGLTGKVDRHFDEILFATLIGSGIGAGAQIAEGSTSVSDPTFGQLALQGASRNINQVGQKFTDKTLNLQPTIIIEPGTRFTIFVTKDITLEPYG